MRAKRKAQAESVAGLLQELQTLNPGTAVISVGDYNAYQFNDGYTDPIATLKGDADARRSDGRRRQPGSGRIRTSSNLTDTLPPSERYSFIFEGTPQALDHVLVNTIAAALRAALRDRARQRRLSGGTGAPVRRRCHAAGALVRSRHAGRVFPLPAAVGRRAVDHDGSAVDRRGRRAGHLHDHRHQRRRRAGAERRRDRPSARRLFARVLPRLGERLRRLHRALRRPRSRCSRRARPQRSRSSRPPDVVSPISRRSSTSRRSRRPRRIPTSPTTPPRQPSSHPTRHRRSARGRPAARSCCCRCIRWCP